MNKICYLLIAFALFAFNNSSFAQLLDPDQPEQDACNALLLCGDSFYTPYSYQGTGNVSDLPFTPCASGEDNSVWLKLIVTGPGSIVFTLTPEDESDDYDFAILDMNNTTCNNLSSSDVIRCQFNTVLPLYNNSLVGLNSTSTLTQVSAGGSSSSQFLQEITASAGDEYLIMINNWGGSGGPSSGFTIDFSGSTATFFSDGPPQVDSIVTACDYSQGLSMQLTQPVNCNSIATDGSDFSISPSGTISSIAGNNCNSSNEGYSDMLQFTFSPPLAPGTYTLQAQSGTDGNVLLDLCDEEMTTDNQITFTIPPLPAYQDVTVACTTLTVHTNIPVNCNSIATDGSDFQISGAATLNVTAAQGINCNANNLTNTIELTLADPINAVGTYIITAQTGSDGNTLLDSCSHAQAVGDTIAFDAPSLSPQLSLPDSITTCINTGIALPLQLLNPVQGVNYTYTWSPANGLSNTGIQQPFALPPATQPYDVVVTSDNPTYCPAYDTITVNMLQGFTILTSDTTICSGATVSVSVAGSDQYAYAWAPSGSVFPSNEANTNITPAQSGTYSLTASYPGCVDSVDYITVNVEPALQVDLGPDQTICYGDSATIESTIVPAGSDYTYQWDPAGNYTPQNAASTIYFGDSSISLNLKVSTPNGCTGSDTIAIFVLPEFLTTASTNDTGYCPGDSVQLSVTGGGTYRWSPAYGLSNDTIANPVASPGVTTDYTVTITNASGCRDTQSIHVAVYPNAVINLPDSVNIYPGETYQIDPETNCLYFQWFPPSGLSATNISNPVASPEVRTRYFVTAETENGCTANDSIDVLVQGTIIDMPNAFTPGSGANNILKPVYRGIVKLSAFRIYNRWGEKVFESNDINKGWDGSFNSKPQPLGVYVYTIEAVTDSGRPFVKQGNITLLR